jgi:Sulfotransferase domain.
MNNIILLTSYPKSGNTWFRTFLSNLLYSSDETINVNQIKTNGIYSSRLLLDEVLGFETSNMTDDEIDYYRPKVFDELAQNLQTNVYIKAHDAYTYLPEGTPIVSHINTKAIYIIRNPLDVSVSLSSHIGKSIGEAIEFMNCHNSCFSKNTDRLNSQLRQQLLTWSEHVESWANAKEIEVHMVRYEDMKRNALETFKNAIDFIGLNKSDQEILDSIEKSDFKKLKKQEDETGFREKPSGMKSFFRKGEIGDWKNHLSESQVKDLITCHRNTMMKYGYIDQSDNITI